LLGPQRRPAVDSVVRSLGVSGPIATVTAGWQEREPDDSELAALLGGRAVNLGLYGRWLDVQERDPEYAAAARALADVLAELADLYLLRLDYALQAVYAVAHRSSAASAAASSAASAAASSAASAAASSAASAVDEAVAAVRALDEAHLSQLNEVRGEFFERLRPHDRPVIAAHRASVAELLASASALIVAGGHVGVLAEVLHLFNVAAALPAMTGPAMTGPAMTGPAMNGRPAVIAWSAGAMALADRIVLFHDRTPHGPGHAEVYGSGLSVVRDLVLLPHARARLLLDDTPRMAVFAQRFAPARCVLLEAGARVSVDDGAVSGAVSGGPRVLGSDGHVTSPGEAA
jgi:hypothetical protein